MRKTCGLILARMGPASADARGVNADASREEGVAEHEIGHYTAAARRFRSATDPGDAHSAEMLALMRGFGATPYGNQILSNAIEFARWAAVAAERRHAVATASAVGTR
jgi:hypothetical protein